MCFLKQLVGGLLGVEKSQLMKALLKTTAEEPLTNQHGLMRDSEKLHLIDYIS